MDRWHDVALSNPGEDDFNTLTLGGVDVVIPLERDPYDDPLQDDELRLRGEDGAYDETLTVDDPNVEVQADNLFLYRFSDVPYGVYRAWVCVGGAWSEVMRGLVVSKKGAYYNGRPLEEGPPAITIAGPISTPPSDEGDDKEPFYLEYIDDVASE